MVNLYSLSCDHDTNELGPSRGLMHWKRLTFGLFEPAGRGSGIPSQYCWRVALLLPTMLKVYQNSSGAFLRNQGVLQHLYRKLSQEVILNIENAGKRLCSRNIVPDAACLQRVSHPLLGGYGIAHIHRVKWRHSSMWPHYDLYVMGSTAYVLCERC